MTNIDSNATEATSKRLRAGVNLRDETERTSAQPAPSKFATVLKFLTRGRGATILELTTATGWQPHSVRAHFSGLRKKGIVLVREARKSGEGTYRIEAAAVVTGVSTPATAAGPVGTTDAGDALTASIVVA